MLDHLDPTTNRMAALSAVILALALLAGCSDGSGPSVANSAPAPGAEAEIASERREIVLSVPGMSCPMCPITVRRALRDVDGVYEAEADLETKQARVVFDPAHTDSATLIAAVENSGFSATLQDSLDE
ncbi:MAG: cation transporter [Wenzhouxiangellaceae bacterium]|nr:cation transporter [Wenzhouxiangellaceae bacterium]